MNRPFLGGLYFYAQIYKPCPKDPVYQISEYLDCQFVRSSKIHQTLTLYFPFLCRNGCQSLDFLKPEFPIPKYAFYQIWLKSVQWFWRISRLNEKFTDGRQTGHDHHSSLEPSAQVI